MLAQRLRKRVARGGRALLAFALIWAGSVLIVSATSLTTFAPVFSQVTNELAALQNSFDGSAAKKQRLGLLSQARSVGLDTELRDYQALAQFIAALGGISEYADNLDLSAVNARLVLLADCDALALRVADLPPGLQTSVARTQFNSLVADRAALSGALHATNVSLLLSPFGRKLALVNRLVGRAARMRPPSIPVNGVRATVNGRAFVSTGDGLHSPNIFSVNAPTTAYREVFCRVVDRSRVLTFNLPALTSLTRYEVVQGLAAATFVQDVFATNSVTLNATGGTFWVQRDRDEVFGLFSCVGPGLSVKDGRFRIRLRGN